MKVIVNDPKTSFNPPLIAWSELYESYVEVVKIRPDGNGVDIYDCIVEYPHPGVEPEHLVLFRKEELEFINWD